MFNRDLWREAKSESFLLGLTISLSAGIGASIVAQAYFLSQIIARVFRSGAHMADLYRPLSTLLAVIALRSLLVFLAEGTARELAIRIKHSLRRRMIRQLHAVGSSFLVTERTGELVNTLGDGVEALDAYFSQYLPQLVIAILTPLIILVAVTTGDLLSAGVLLITAPLIPLFMALVGYGSQRTVQRRWQTLSQMSAHFLDVVQGLTTLKILGQSRAQIAKVARISKQYGEATLGVLRVTFLSALVLELVSTLSIAIVAVEIGLRLLNGTLLFSDALFVLILAPEFYLPLRMLGTRFHAGMNGTAAGRRIFGLFPANRNESTITEDLSVPRGPTCIQFRHVSYAFDGGERPAVRNVSFDIKPGQHLAIVGPSGAGKSTLLHLLLGFISAQEGRILVGDQPLESLDRARWLAQIAWMPEHPHLFHDTVAANIRMGNSQADDSAIVEAARLAGAHEFICALPQGYETNIGEQGVRLSGGQAQRLALARVFLKKASIYIFDEPTANIDSATETIITETIRRLARSQTVITITHRLHTVLGADNAIVLQEGRIVRQGVPARLFAADGYAHVPCNGAGAPPDRRLAMDAVVTPSFPSTGALVPDIGGDGMRSAKQFGHVSRLHTVRRLISLLNGHWHWILVSVLLGALAIGSAIGLLGVSAYLISAASLQPSIADLGVAIVAVRFFGLARGIFRYLERLASHTVTFRLLADLRTWTFAALEPLAPARLSAVGSGDLLARLVSDVTTLENFYVRAVAPPIVAIVVIAGLAGFLFAVHWQLAVAALACLTLSGLFLPWAAHASSRHFAQRLIRARSKSNTLLVDAIQGMADLEAFGYAKTFANRVKQSVSDLARAQRSLGWVAALQEGAAVLVAGVATWLVLFLAIPYVISSQISGVYLATLVLATYAAFEATNPLPQAAQQLASSLEAGGRLFLLGALEPAVKEPQQPASAPERPHLGLRALTFQYEDAKQSALQQVDLDILPGKRMAIVGASGAGKTTLANLLLRFWECQEGQLLLNDQPIQAFAADDVRRLFNVLSQHTYLFNATIRDNIRLSQPEASQEDVIRAARRAQMHEFVTSLPHGYETVIGERGLQLSGGQRQRLALARCLLRPAPILLLDEPTANLDVNTELALLESVHRQLQGRTLIVITHRLVNMTAYDEIVVLDEGKIVERGCHADLLQLNGHYARLWRLQQGVTAPQLAYEKERVSVSHI